MTSQEAMGNEKEIGQNNGKGAEKRVGRVAKYGITETRKLRINGNEYQFIRTILRWCF